jgi:hypothetical protein
MAISDEQKLDYLWKKIVFGYTKTDTNEVKQAVNESIVSSLILRGDTIWNDSNLIPDVIPDFNTEVVEVYNDTGNAEATVECIEDPTASPRRTWLTKLENWIPSEFGATYQVKVYIDDVGSASPQTTGQQIFATGSENNDEWFFDYQPGVLHFIGENLPPGLVEGKAIYIVGARYIGGVGLQGEQGLFGDLTISGDTVSSQAIDGNLVLRPNGAGQVQVVSSLTVKKDLDVNGVINADTLEGDIDGGFF